MPQDQDDIKGDDAMKQAPTPGPLSGDDVNLKPCPFCGNDVASQGFWYGAMPGDVPRGYHVFCLECSDTDALDGPRRETLEEAIEAWNARPSFAPSAPVEASGSERSLEANIGWFVGRARKDGFHAQADWLERQIAALHPQPSWPEEVQTADTTHSRRLFFGDPGSLQPGGETREAVRLALEDADALERVSEEADDNQWPDWAATMRQAASRLRRLAPVASGGEHSSGEIDRGRIEAIVREAVTAASVEVPERFADRVAMRFEITQNATDAIVSALSDTTAPVAETAGEAVAWRYRYPNDTDWQITQDHDQAFRNTGEVEPLGVIPFGVPAQDDDKLRIEPGATEAFDAIDVADRLIERAYGDEIPADWTKAHGRVAKARAALKSTAAQEGGSK